MPHGQRPQQQWWLTYTGAFFSDQERRGVVSFGWTGMSSVTFSILLGHANKPSLSIAKLELAVRSEPLKLGQPCRLGPIYSPVSVRGNQHNDGPSYRPLISREDVISLPSVPMSVLLYLFIDSKMTFTLQQFIMQGLFFLPWRVHITGTRVNERQCHPESTRIACRGPTAEK